MLSNPKYITNGIAGELPIELQLLLWSMIAELQNKIQLDYLQVFKLTTIEIDGQILQQITHTQEVPPYKNTVTVKVNSPISNRKIFCIDDDTHNPTEYDLPYCIWDEYTLKEYINKNPDFKVNT